METSTQDEYREPPCSRQGPFRRPQTPPQSPSPMSACSAATNTHEIDPPAYTSAPYLDTPPSSYCDSSPASTSTSPTSRPHHQQPFTFHIYSPTTDYTPLTRPSYSDDDSDDDSNVPLAQLLVYPRDEPPAYSTVVRHSYRETLLPHLPRHGVVVDLDEEAALERVHADDVRFKVERVVAMAAVMALLLLTGVFVGLMFVRR